MNTTDSPGVSQPMSNLRMGLSDGADSSDQPPSSLHTGLSEGADSSVQPSSPRRALSFSRKRASPRAPGVEHAQLHDAADGFKRPRVRLAASSDGEKEHSPLLPIIVDGAEHADLKCISSDTLRRLLSGEFADRVGRIILYDCRFPFEYAGGHIVGALNAHDPAAVAEVREGVHGTAHSQRSPHAAVTSPFHCAAPPSDALYYPWNTSRWPPHAARSASPTAADWSEPSSCPSSSSRGPCCSNCCSTTPCFC
jgi:hypothetical protein